MPDQNFTPKLIAHWIFTPDEWQAFSHYEKIPDQQRKSSFQFIKIRENHFWGNIILGVFILFFFVALPIFIYVKFEIPLTISLLAVTIIGLLLVFINNQIFPEPKLKSIKVSGDVKITTHGVNLNGRPFDWGYDKEGWHLSAIERAKISLENNKTMDLITFKCLNNYHPNEEKKITIPSPLMNETEVNEIVNAFNQTKNIFSDGETETVWENLNYVLAAKVRPFTHDFDSKNFTCKKCGSSIEAARHFKLECKPL